MPTGAAIASATGALLSRLTDFPGRAAPASFAGLPENIFHRTAVF
ncbi:hypothetical protein [Mycobacteroides abscessus]|nr:hypothetical protein [Mycobacteroides abscessus]